MKTDSLFYRLFQSAPTLLFELLGESVTAATGYRFASIELKQTAFRIDGVFLPPEENPDASVYFLEVQFQKNPLLYRRLFAEVFLYLRQHPQVQRWQAVVLYPNPAVEVTEPEAFGELLTLSQVQVIYLNELGEISELSPGLGILRLLVEPSEAVPEAAKAIIKRVQQSSQPAADIAKIVELVETIVVYTFPHRSYQEIAAMLGLTTIQETRVYREGREEEALSLVSRQLTRKLGELPEALQSQVNQLSLEALEALAEALFDFAEASDLEQWLSQSQQEG